MTANFEAAYGTIMAKPVWPTIEETLMMRPDFCMMRCGTTARVVRKTPRRLMSRTRSNSSSVRSLDGRRVRAHAGVVDEDVNTAELLECLVDEVLGRVGFAYVVLDAQVAVAELLGALFCFFFEDVRQHDAGALVGHGLGDAESEATSSARDDDDTVLKIPHSSPPIACVARLLQSGRWPRCSTGRSCPGRTEP